MNGSFRYLVLEGLQSQLPGINHYIAKYDVIVSDDDPIDSIGEDGQTWTDGHGRRSFTRINGKWVEYDGRTFQADDWLNYGSYFYIPQRFALSSKSNINGAGLPTLSNGALYNDNNQGAIKTLSDTSSSASAMAEMPQQVVDAIVAGKEFIMGGVVRLGNLTRQQSIMGDSDSNGFEIRQDTDGTFQFRREDGAATTRISSTAVTFNANDWYGLAFHAYKDELGLTAYMNRELIGKATGGSEWISASDKLRIGHTYSNSIEFDGWVRDFFVFVPNSKFYALSNDDQENLRQFILEFASNNRQDKDLRESVFHAIGSNLPTSFIQLTDTPTGYLGQAGRFPKVNAAETGLEYGDADLSDYFNKEEIGIEFDLKQNITDTFTAPISIDYTGTFAGAYSTTRRSPLSWLTGYESGWQTYNGAAVTTGSLSGDNTGKITIDGTEYDIDAIGITSSFRNNSPPAGLHLSFSPNNESESIFAWIGSKKVVLSNTNSSVTFLGNRFIVEGEGDSDEELLVPYSSLSFHEIVSLFVICNGDFRLEISDASGTVYTATHDIIISDDDPDNGVGDEGMTWLSTDGTKSWFKYNGAWVVIRSSTGTQGKYRVRLYAKVAHGATIPAAPTNATYDGTTISNIPAGWSAAFFTTLNEATEDGYESFAEYDPANSSLSGWSIPFRIGADGGPPGPPGSKGEKGDKGDKGGRW